MAGPWSVTFWGLDSKQLRDAASLSMLEKQTYEKCAMNFSPPIATRQDSPLKYGPYCSFIGVIFTKNKSSSRTRKADAEETVPNIGLFKRRFSTQSNS
jgi:hypothetical protein